MDSSELSIAHSFGTIFLSHPGAKSREICRIFEILGFGDLGVKKDLYFYTILVKYRLQPKNPTLLNITYAAE